MCWTFIIHYGTRIFMEQGMGEQDAEVLAQQHEVELCGVEDLHHPRIGQQGVHVAQGLAQRLRVDDVVVLRRADLQQAELLAKRLEGETESNEACVERAWELCFQRPPEKSETADSISFIEAEGLVQFARAMLNANEFVFIP